MKFKDIDVFRHLKALPRNFHVMLIVAAPEDKSGTTYCHEDPVSASICFGGGERNMPLFWHNTSSATNPKY